MPLFEDEPGQVPTTLTNSLSPEGLFVDTGAPVETIRRSHKEAHRGDHARARWRSFR
jgi:hypothetical protein